MFITSWQRLIFYTFNMFSCIFNKFIAFIMILFLSGCVSTQKYDGLEVEKEQLLKRIEELQENYQTLQMNLEEQNMLINDLTQRLNVDVATEQSSKREHNAKEELKQAQSILKNAGIEQKKKKNQDIQLFELKSEIKDLMNSESIHIANDKLANSFIIDISQDEVFQQIANKNSDISTNSNANSNANLNSSAISNPNSAANVNFEVSSKSLLWIRKLSELSNKKNNLNFIISFIPSQNQNNQTHLLKKIQLLKQVFVQNGLQQKYLQFLVQSSTITELKLNQPAQ